jgi:hypothetical protein
VHNFLRIGMVAIGLGIGAAHCKGISIRRLDLGKATPRVHAERSARHAQISGCGPGCNAVRVGAVGRVNRLMERRVLRRAADEALLTPTFVRSVDMPTVMPITAPPADTADHADDADRWGAEPDTDGREPLDAITEPIAVTAVHERLRDAPDDVGLDDAPPTAHTH